jgi:hypothetical protein
VIYFLSNNPQPDPKKEQCNVRSFQMA